MKGQMLPGFMKPMSLVDARTIRATAERLGLDIPEQIDDQRRLRAENFASRILAMLAKVENRNDPAEVYEVVTTFAYNSDAAIAARD